MYFTPERRRGLAVKLFDHVRHGTTDMEPSLLELDLSSFSDPNVAVRERERIFERLPMMALHSSQLPEPNSFATVRLNRSGILATRLRNGTVRAMVDVCRHRGATLVSEANGKRPAFTCPYHGWSYGNDGSLKRIGLIAFRRAAMLSGASSYDTGSKRPGPTRFSGCVT